MPFLPQMYMRQFEGLWIPWIPESKIFRLEPHFLGGKKDQLPEPSSDQKIVSEIFLRFLAAAPFPNGMRSNLVTQHRVRQTINKYGKQISSANKVVSEFVLACARVHSA